MLKSLFRKQRYGKVDGVEFELRSLNEEIQ